MSLYLYMYLYLYMCLYLYMYLYLYLDMYFCLYWTPLCNKSWRETSIKSLPILPFCPSAPSENPWRSTVKGNPVWPSSPKSILISCFQPTLLRSRQSTKCKVRLFVFLKRICSDQNSKKILFGRSPKSILVSSF